MITGSSGFVAGHFIRFIYENNIPFHIVCVDISDLGRDVLEYKSKLNIVFEKVDILDRTSVDFLLKKYRPEYVLHLAAFSSVAYSWKNPDTSFLNNTNIFLNIVEAIRRNNINCRVLSVGSSEEYGNVTAEMIPLTENMYPNPISPYAVARVSQEMISKVYVDGYDMDIVLTRSFNHIGPYQDIRFAIPSFVKQICDIKKSGKISGIIEVGDIHIIRDFVDVRDVVKAYYILLKEGRRGEIYNICSGTGVSLKELIEKIAEIVGVSVTTHACEEYRRNRDNMIIVGSHDKITSEFGWEPKIPITDTLQDMIIEEMHEKIDK